jgi:uncharacterized protein (DUF1330 family)
MPPIRLTVKLWVKDGAFQSFEAFETAAFKIMKQHGADILSVDRNHSATDGSPHEIHILEFPSTIAFEDYRTDPALLAMSGLREQCIAKTEVTVGSQRSFAPD